MLNRFLLLSSLLSGVALIVAPSAEAQDDAADNQVPPSDGMAPTDPGQLDAPAETAEEPPPVTEEPARLDDEQAEVEDAAPQEAFRDSTDPHEEAGQDYFFLGALYRQVIVPGFIQGLFVQGGIDGFNPGTGIFFNWRKDNFNVLAEVWWNNAAGQGYFRAQGDDPTETEFIEANLFVIFVNASFLWSFPITDWFAIDLGFDLGVGFVGGSLTRTEARPTTAAGDEYQPCVAPGEADPTGAGYCETNEAPAPCYNNEGGHYNCTEPNWFTEGGDTPVIMPWVTLPHLAVRFKPIHQLQIRIDGGYGLYNFFFGATAAYGF